MSEIPPLCPECGLPRSAASRWFQRSVDRLLEEGYIVIFTSHKIQGYGCRIFMASDVRAGDNLFKPDAEWRAQAFGGTMAEAFHRAELVVLAQRAT